MTRDSGRLPQGGDAKQAPCVASQSGPEGIAQTSGPNPNNPPTSQDGLLLGCCGDNASPIPADMVGCGKAFASFTEVYRCTHCDVLFHKNCAEKHFQDDNVLTEEMIVEIERRDALKARASQ